MVLKKFFEYLLFVFVALLLVGCGKTDALLYSVDDLDGSRIAVLDHAVSDNEFEEQFPESDISHFKSSSEFLLALSIGKCDAGIVEKSEGELILRKNSDYDSLSCRDVVGDAVILIAHRNLLPGKNLPVNEDGLFSRSVRRVHRSVISDGYWILLLKGFATTMIMFSSGILMAFALAILLMWMNGRKYMSMISKPLSYFIKTIHDVPSVVLIFFFYYFVFASVDISGIVVCAISLGVYTSGSLMNVFKIHLNQVDRNQHAAAQMLGLTGWKKYRYVILPQAVKPMLPLIAAESKVLLRATTYAGYISELDLVKVTEIIRNQTYDVLVPLLLVSVIFLLLSRLIVKSLSVIYNKALKYD